ncbi:MAG: EamA family transporter [Firmicutes bacterium]|nr:EamA family transporter [Bacillota bacterium]MBR6970732.1 EamA family transporter [Bacillota bacterium]
MFDYIWPIALVVLSNTFYQICAKEVPEKMDPFASLTVTYLVGAAVSFALFGLLNRGGSIIAEYQKLNWAPFVLGLVLVGLETGFIYAYRAGWTVSTAAIVQSAFLGVVLIFVGMLLYKEVVTPTKVAGILICLVGLYFINK